MDLYAFIAIAAVAVILGAPILSSYGVTFRFVENILVRIVLISLIVVAVRKDHLLGLLTFLAVFSLLLERNHNLVLGLPDQRPSLHPLRPKKEDSSPFLEMPVMTLATTLASPQATTVDSASKLASPEQPPITQLHDNIPKLAPSPKSRDAPEFFRGFL
jgi:hypothetical protein